MGSKEDLENLVLISSTKDNNFALNVANYLKKSLCETKKIGFKDSDLKTKIADKETVRGRDVYLIMTFTPTLAERLQELIVWTDALVSGAAKSLTFVLPYFFGSRQDRKTERGEPVNIRAYINALRGAAGGDRTAFITVDIHSEQSLALAREFDNVKPLPLYASDIRSNYGTDVVIVSPDAGGVRKCESLREMLQTEGLAWIAKTRPEVGKSEVLGLSGHNVEGKTAVIVDDIIDGGGTIVNAYETLMKNGAKNVVVYATHLLLTENATEKLKSLEYAKFIGTDTVLQPNSVLSKLGIRILPISYVVAEAIRRKHLAISTLALYTEKVVEICGLGKYIKK